MPVAADAKGISLERPANTAAALPGGGQDAAKKRAWTKKWAALFIGLTVLQVIYFGYAYWQGSKGNERYAAIYNLVHHPSLKTFKRWLAHMASDPVGEIILAFFVLLIPFPYMPYYAHERIEVFLAKLGIFYVLLAVFLGAPTYDPEKKRNPKEYLPVFIFMIALILLVIFSYLNAHNKLPFSF